MDFDSDFWVVIATAAPVIALASVVLFSDQMNQLYSLKQQHGKRGVKPEKTASVSTRCAVIANCFAFSGQVIAFFASLESLIRRSNYASMQRIVIAEVAGLVLLFVTIVAMASSKAALRLYEDENEKPRPDEPTGA